MNAKIRTLGLSTCISCAWLCGCERERPSDAATIEMQAQPTEQQRPAAMNEQPAASGDASVARSDTAAAGSADAGQGTAQDTTVEAARAASVLPASVDLGPLGACQPSEQLDASVSRLVTLADSNKDGQVSRTEAQNFANFFVGGFFFRADGNADGTITPDEGREARRELLAQHPWLASTLQRGRVALGESPVAALAEILDVDYGKPLTTDDARETTRKLVSDLYRVADANRDNQLTLSEGRQLGLKTAQAAGGALFASADADKDGRITAAEYDTAITTPAKAAFTAADADKDGALTRQEASAALGQLAARMNLNGQARPE